MIFWANAVAKSSQVHRFNWPNILSAIPQHSLSKRTELRTLHFASHCKTTQERSRIALLLTFPRTWQALQHQWFWSTAQQIFRNATGYDDFVNPKKLLERKYAYLALLAIKTREIQLQQRQDSNCTENALPASDDAAHDRAIQSLEKYQLDGLSNVQLRQLLQREIRPQVVSIFKAFQQIDNEIGLGSRPSTLEELRWPSIVKVVEDDRVLTAEKLEAKRRDPASPSKAVGDITSKKLSTRQTSQVAFFERKLQAIDTVLAFHHQHDLGRVSEAESKSSMDFLDAFGIHTDPKVTSDSSLRLIRLYQTINLCRSALLRKHCGFSVLTLRSTVTHSRAGRGAFLDGCCALGAIMAFQPGEVWPKEHLLTTAPDVMAHFEHDDDCHVSLRFDDYVVDARPAPVTVLSTTHNTNPWALAHMVNHPPQGMLPNCQSTMLNFTESMELTAELLRYIPNVYARPPSWRSKFLEQDSDDAVIMHALALISRRDIEDEELFYDYRLQAPADQTPDWYNVVTYNDGGFLDGQDQVVFFRHDWQGNEK